MLNRIIEKIMGNLDSAIQFLNIKYVILIHR
jgi:hypothetical protein